MTIQFNCPYCDALIAFDSKYAGKRVRCLTCGQLLIIPSKDHEKPQKVEEKIQRTEPLPGFYRAVFVGSWKLLIDRENATSLVFVVAAVGFKFLLGRGICCMNYISCVVVWAWLLGFYLNIIYETAYDIDKLPEIYLGTSITFLWYIIKPLSIFFFTMAAMQIPFIIALSAFQSNGVTIENMWQAELGPRLLLQALFILGLFLFPAAILTIAVGKDFTLLRPDYVFAPAFRAFLAYMVTAALLVAAAVLETQTGSFVGDNLPVEVGHFALNLAVQVIAIIAMRSIGLFYRHYSCYFRW
jgi:hypothetical protein